ncbi:MFS general substrate transporter [Coccomyxa subellipsoidea C-169]|uniref:MFS general substrate transporter n=1 Tax=Coccomyxa subellipsoidea (strain C-169) TaxID=574566 RepID=I0Z7Y4_COCSC|nr:MFS general substrate transporter [Coccomyxa subellipsoidea C-169]EIE26753.1 MFS general substrate transporter [Coccomyxa subellipsoidea C-169]|eukprot:XP_005651297.1 MFS general substrate transporter [Coccomyxa subellipsoidea C-169]
MWFPGTASYFSSLLQALLDLLAQLLHAAHESCSGTLCAETLQALDADSLIPALLSLFIANDTASYGARYRAMLVLTWLVRCVGDTWRYAWSDPGAQWDSALAGCLEPIIRQVGGTYWLTNLARRDEQWQDGLEDPHMARALTGLLLQASLADAANRAYLAAEDLICVLQDEAEAVTMSAALLLMASDAITVPMQTKLATCHLLTALLSPREATQALFLDPTGEEWKLPGIEGKARRQAALSALANQRRARAAHTAEQTRTAHRGSGSVGLQQSTAWQQLHWVLLLLKHLVLDCPVSQASVAEAGGISVLARLWDFALGEPELLQDLLGLSGNLVADSTTAQRTFFSQASLLPEVMRITQELSRKKQWCKLPAVLAVLANVAASREGQRALLKLAEPSGKTGGMKRVPKASSSKVTVWARRRTTLACAVAFTAEEADKVLLTSMYLAIGSSLKALPSQLGQLTMYRALVQAIFIPFVGILGNECNRIFLIAIGSLWWGGMSIGFGFAHRFQEATIWAALSGVGLALVLPCVQAIIAELYTAFERGRAFGFLFTVSALGGVIGTFCAISFGNRAVHGVEVWRVLFWAMAGISLITCVIILTMAVEPRSINKQVADGKEAGAGGGEQKGCTKAVLWRMWGRLVVIMEGAWRLLGFSDLATGGMAVCASIGAAVGFLLGGGAGDYLSMRFPNTARPAVNQISQVLAGPLYVALLKGLPGSSRYASGYPHSLDHYAALYGFVLFFIAFFGTWPASNNAAIFAEVVPEGIRTSVYAFDKCVAGAIGALGAPLIGILAERVFGFKGSLGDSHGSGAKAHGGVVTPGVAANNVNNARAIENGLLWMTVIPMILKIITYGGLYWTLPRDRVEELFEEEVEEEEQAVEGADLEASKTKKDMDDDNAPAGLERAPTLRRNVSIRRELRGEELSDRYFSLDLATLGREAIRGLLNPANKPASQLNPLAVFAGAAFDVSRDTARTSQSRAELSREYRKTGSAVVSRAQLGTQTLEYADDRRRARAFTSLPAASGDLRGALRSAAGPASGGQEDSGSQGLVDERPPKKTPMTLPKFRASGQPLDSTSSAQGLDPSSSGQRSARRTPPLPPSARRDPRATPPLWEGDTATPGRGGRSPLQLPSVDESEERPADNEKTDGRSSALRDSP